MLHVVPFKNLFAGHAAFTPSQVSATSQTPLFGRHCVPALPGVFVQPLVVLHPSTVQGLLSLQSTCAPPHTPAEHVSFIVQALPSLQLVPVRFEQTPDALHA